VRKRRHVNGGDAAVAGLGLARRTGTSRFWIGSRPTHGRARTNSQRTGLFNECEVRVKDGALTGLSRGTDWAHRTRTREADWDPPKSAGVRGTKCEVRKRRHVKGGTQPSPDRTGSPDWDWRSGLGLFDFGFPILDYERRKATAAWKTVGLHHADRGSLNGLGLAKRTRTGEADWDWRSGLE
jgi:hypothetical protein